jgi:hypothetical protein
MNDTPTPDTDSAQCEGLLRGNAVPTHVVHVNFARKLERERDAAKAALSGRTVSCSNCNAMAEELAAMKKVIRKIYYETETCADGAPDATDHDKLCNDISSQLEPFIK